MGGMKGIQPVMVICLERDADLHMTQLMPLPLTVSSFSKIQIGFTFLVPAHPGSPVKRAVKRVCVLLTCKEHSSLQPASPLQELTCHMASHRGDIPAFPRGQRRWPKDLVTPEGCNTELTWLTGYILRHIPNQRPPPIPILARLDVTSLICLCHQLLLC